VKQKYIATICILILIISFNCIGEVKKSGELSANYDRIQKSMDNSRRNADNFQRNQDSIKKLTDDMQRDQDSNLRVIRGLKRDSTDNEVKHILAIIIPKEVRERIDTYVFEYKMKKLKLLIENYNGSIGFVEVEKIKSHGLVWDMKKNRKSNIHDLLPLSLQAEFWDDEITVFMISEDNISDSTTQANVYIINLPEKNIVGVTNMSVSSNEIWYFSKSNVNNNTSVTIPQYIPIEQFMNYFITELS